MDEFRERVKNVQKALDQDAAFIQPDPFLAQRVLHAAKRERGHIVMKKRTFAWLLTAGLLLFSLTAYAVTQLVGHEVQLYEGVEIRDLLPVQRQGYDVCHRVQDGYLIGGFQLGDDYIAPMDEEDAIVLLDGKFRVRWTLTDPRLTGCLFDRVYETGDALYLGTECAVDTWHPALMKLDRQGNIRWFYEGSSAFRMKDFAVDGDGRAICVGRVETDGVSRPCVVVLDAQGHELPALDLPEAGMTVMSAVCVQEDRTFLAGYGDGTVWFGEINGEGKLRWDKSIRLDAPIRTLRLQGRETGEIVLSVEYRDPQDAGASSSLRYYVISLEEQP